MHVNGADFLRNLKWVTEIYIAFTILIGLIEWRFGGRVRRYGTRAHFQQFVWYLFRNTGTNDILLFWWFYAILHRYLGFLDLHLLDHSRLAMRFAVIFLAVDLAQYWVHRLRHSVSLLWTFHTMHHAAESLTPGGMDQVHPVEDYVGGFFLGILLMMLGAYPQEWFGIMMVRKFTEFMQHSEIDWDFGPLYYIFVSPAFHRVHHSRSPEFHDKNFGTHLSVWDYLFGTAVRPAVIPTEYGVENVTLPTLVSQVWWPFRTAWRQIAGKLGTVRTAPAEAPIAAAARFVTDNPVGDGG